ncbi:MAG: PilZ domain-containing protein [Bacteriovoracia bacterium]
MGKNFTNQQVVNLSSVRQELIEEKRRTYERVVFRSNFGVYTVLEEGGLHAIEVVDISEGGMQFQTSENSTLKLDTGSVIPVRFYFATDHFISIDVRVVRSFSAIEDGRAVHRYGCLMDKTMASYAAIFHFVQFITKCAEHGHKDDAHLKVFY